MCWQRLLPPAGCSARRPSRYLQHHAARSLDARRLFLPFSAQARGWRRAPFSKSFSRFASRSYLETAMGLKRQER